MPVVGLVALLGVLYTVVIIGVLKRHGRTQAPTVMRHLRQRGTYTLRIGPFAGVWTPEPPPAGQLLPTGFVQTPGRGTLTYLSEPDPSSVRLRWQPRHGPPSEWVGPAPFTVLPEFQNRLRRGPVLGLIVFVAVGAVGAASGALGGSLPAGLVGGLLVGGYLGPTLWLGSARRAARGSVPASRAPGAQPPVADR